MTDEPPAKTLRRAAALMRESAPAMRPGVGVAAAELFDEAADAWETGEPWWGSPLTLARALIGETEATTP